MTTIISGDYNEYIEKETLPIEYKEFTFNPSGIKIDNTIAEEYCKSNRFDFNKQVISNLKKYFKIYTPKYMTSFFNSKINGELFIGVDDWGFVKGIPYKGEIPIDILKSKFYKILKNYVKNDTYDFEKIVKINCIKLNNVDKPTTELCSTYTKYVEQRSEHAKIISDYKEVYNNWKIKYAYVSRKLTILVNDKEVRILIIDFIKKINPLSNVIKILESPDNVEFLTNEEISKIVRDQTNPYYWVSEWKEHICEEYRMERPEFTGKYFNNHVPINIINSISEMIPFWMANNDDMNLYVIHIEFMFDHIETELEWKYFDEKVNDWIVCFRTLDRDGDPYTVKAI